MYQICIDSEKKVPEIISYQQVAVGRREKLQVFGSDYPTHDGTGVRDYIHITDLAIGHLSALEKMLEPTFNSWKAYNLGTGKIQISMPLYGYINI